MSNRPYLDHDIAVVFAEGASEAVKHQPMRKELPHEPQRRTQGSAAGGPAMAESSTAAVSHARAASLEARRPAVIFSNGIGDHLLNLPALRALAALFPGRLTLLCNTGSSQTFFSQLPLRAVIEADMQQAESGKSFDAESLARAVAPCDLLLSLNPWHSGSMDRLITLLDPEHSIGYFPAFQISLPREYSKHSAELAFDMPRFFDPLLQLDDFAEAPDFPRRHRDHAQRIRHVFPVDQRIMTVHADTRAEKMWASDRFTRVLTAFVSRHPEIIVFVIGPTDPDFVCSSERHAIFSCCGLPLATAMCLVAESDLFLGVDSCMLHAADLLRVPGVGLFGPTSCDEWGFRFGPGRHVCGNGSMDNITADVVLRALEDILAHVASRPRC
jgi:ADP-heptose:LPS heptosyltransferase